MTDEGFSMTDITVYTGHRNPASLLHYCNISTYKGGAVTQALLGRTVVTADSVVNRAPPIQISTPPRSFKGTGKERKRRSDFELGVDNLLNDDETVDNTPIRIANIHPQKSRREMILLVQAML